MRVSRKQKQVSRGIFGSMPSRLWLQVLQKRSLNEKGKVFVNIKGEPLRGYKHWFDPAVEEAGLRDFTRYYLRHTFASRLAMAGVDLLTISELMGHKTIQM